MHVSSKVLASQSASVVGLCEQLLLVRASYMVQFVAQHPASLVENWPSRLSTPFGMRLLTERHMLMGLGMMGAVGNKC